MVSKTTVRALFASILWALIATTPIMAQGTASGPTTQHLFNPASNEVWVGGPNDTVNGPAPFPIDLDLNGLPWTKEITSSGTFVGGGMTLHETILNAGTEPWWDWHEQVTGAAIGAGWNTVLSVKVNGLPITFNTSISGIDLTLDGFSQPVLPGDVFEITKNLITTENVVASGQLLVTVTEYPTPEPASLTVMGLGILVMCRRQR